MPRPLLFDHMPKCGGASFTEYLRRFYPADRTLELDGTNNAATVAAFAQRPEHDRMSIELVIGHAARDAMPHTRGDSVRVTCFREPAERLVSLYHYTRRQPMHPRHKAVNDAAMDFDAFLTSGVTPETRNYYCYQLSRIPRDEIDSAPEAAVDAALGFLAREFDVVGFLDRFESFAGAVRRTAHLYRRGERLRDALGLLGPVRIGETNAAPERSSANGLPPRTLDTIASLNAADLILYGRLRGLIGRRLDGGRCRVV